MDKLEHYLDQVCRSIGGPKSLRQHVRQELREHLLDAIAGHKAAGLPEEQALDRALEDFGGPDQVRTELEATHGHRLMPVVIDKAMQWKEMTMKAKWLWTTWVYVAVIGVVAMQVLFLAFSTVYLVPKLKKIRSDGWLEDAFTEPSIQWGYSFLDRVSWVIEHLTWPLLGLAALWGLFEWRIRSENKSLMRLSALGTGAVALMVVVILVAAALVLPFMMGFPAMTRIARPFAVEQVSTIDTSITALEEASANKDWPALQEQATQASQAANRLEAAIGAVPAGKEPPTLNELRSQLSAAKESLAEAQQAIRDKDAERLKAALKKFHESYEPVRQAAKRAQK